MKENWGQKEEREENRQIHFQELLNLSDGQTEKIRKMIAENDGLICVLVHPFFFSDQDKKTISDETGESDNGTFVCQTKGYAKKEENEYYKRLVDLVESCSQKQIPLIVFQEADKIEDLNYLFADLNNENVIIIPTKKSSPCPYFADKPDEFDISRKKLKENNDNLVAAMSTLHNLGAKKAIIGGRKLILDRYRPYGYYPHHFINLDPFSNFKEETFAHKKIHTTGCVGLVAQALRENLINVEFSNIAGIFYLENDMKEK